MNNTNLGNHRAGRTSFPCPLSRPLSASAFETKAQRASGGRATHPLQPVATTTELLQQSGGGAAGAFAAATEFAGARWRPRDAQEPELCRRATATGLLSTIL